MAGIGRWLRSFVNFCTLTPILTPIPRKKAQKTQKVGNGLGALGSARKGPVPARMLSCQFLHADTIFATALTRRALNSKVLHKMSESQPWYAVRCLFSHPTRVNDGDGNLYEERITLWKCGCWDEAFRSARLEAEIYAKEADAILIDTTNAFHLFDAECGHGSEIWSIMRGSHLDAQNYTNTFCITDRDRQHDYTGPE